MLTIVTIKGIPGIGKTSVAKTLAHWYLKRKVFANGIIYISVRGIESTGSFITQLFFASGESKEADSGQDKLKNVISTLKLKNLLLIVDNAEDPIMKDKVKFTNTIQQLLEGIPKLRILLTSRIVLGSLPDLTERVYTLSPLDSESSLTLLKKRAPKVITNGEIIELLGKEYKESDTVKEKEKKFEEHELMKRLAGHPQAISLAAALLHKCNLLKLFQELNSSCLNANEMHSLKISLGVSVEHVRIKNENSVSFLRMMALFPCGACDEDMNAVWGSGYERHVGNLQDVSLLLKREIGNSKEDRYWLLPFMADYALVELKEYNIDHLHVNGWKYYGNKLRAAIMTDTNFNNKEILQIKDEPNILAFLNVGKGQIEEKKLDILEEEEKVPGPDPNEIKIRSKDKKGMIPSREAAEMLGNEERELFKPKLNPDKPPIIYEKADSFKLDFVQEPIPESPHLFLASPGIESVYECKKSEVILHSSLEEVKKVNTSKTLFVATGRSRKSPKKEDSIIPIRKNVLSQFSSLLVYYCANLILMHRDLDAEKTKYVFCYLKQSYLNY